MTHFGAMFGRLLTAILALSACPRTVAAWPDAGADLGQVAPEGGLTEQQARQRVLQMLRRISLERGDRLRGDAGFSTQGLHGPCGKGCAQTQVCVESLGLHGPSSSCELTCGQEACPAAFHCVAFVDGPAAVCAENEEPTRGDGRQP